MGEFVVVPVSELQKLEESRVKLYELLESQTDSVPFLCKLTNITQPMWELANHKWPAAPKPEAEPVDGGKVWSIVRSAMGAVQYLDKRGISSEERHALIDSYASEYADKIAALYAAPPAQKQPAPVRTCDRLPTEADADCHGQVWACYKGDWRLLYWYSAVTGGTAYSHWQPTGLRKPADPED